MVFAVQCRDLQRRLPGVETEGSAPHGPGLGQLSAGHSEETLQQRRLAGSKHRQGNKQVLAVRKNSPQTEVMLSKGALSVFLLFFEVLGIFKQALGRRMTGTGFTLLLSSIINDRFP